MAAKVARPLPPDGPSPSQTPGPDTGSEISVGDHEFALEWAASPGEDAVASARPVLLDRSIASTSTASTATARGRLAVASATPATVAAAPAPAGARAGRRAAVATTPDELGGLPATPDPAAMLVQSALGDAGTTSTLRPGGTTMLAATAVRGVGGAPDTTAAAAWRDRPSPGWTLDRPAAGSGSGTGGSVPGAAPRSGALAGGPMPAPRFDLMVAERSPHIVQRTQAALASPMAAAAAPMGLAAVAAAGAGSSGGGSGGGVALMGPRLTDIFSPQTQERMWYSPMRSFLSPLRRTMRALPRDAPLDLKAGVDVGRLAAARASTDADEVGSQHSQALSRLSDVSPPDALAGAGLDTSRLSLDDVPSIAAMSDAGTDAGSITAAADPPARPSAGPTTPADGLAAMVRSAAHTQAQLEQSLDRQSHHSAASGPALTARDLKPAAITTAVAASAATRSGALLFLPDVPTDDEEEDDGVGALADDASAVATAAAFSVRREAGTSAPLPPTAAALAWSWQTAAAGLGGSPAPAPAPPALAPTPRGTQFDTGSPQTEGEPDPAPHHDAVELTDADDNIATNEGHTHSEREREIKAAFATQQQCAERAARTLFRRRAYGYVGREGVGTFRMVVESEDGGAGQALPGGVGAPMPWQGRELVDLFAPTRLDRLRGLFDSPPPPRSAATALAPTLTAGADDAALRRAVSRLDAPAVAVAEDVGGAGGGDPALRRAVALLDGTIDDDEEDEDGDRDPGVGHSGSGDVAVRRAVAQLNVSRRSDRSAGTPDAAIAPPLDPFEALGYNTQNGRHELLRILERLEHPDATSLPTSAAAASADVADGATGEGVWGQFAEVSHRASDNDDDDEEEHATDLPPARATEIDDEGWATAANADDGASPARPAVVLVRKRYFDETGRAPRLP
jgi:hypothetical protein